MEWREQFVCQRTGLSVRWCTGFLLGLAGLDDWPRDPLYFAEYASKPDARLKQRLPCLRGSECFPDSQHEELARKLRYLDSSEAPHFEDLMALSFEGRRFGLVLSFDVLEHVPDHRRALQEFARGFKLGGYLVLTAPFMHDRQDTLIGATLDQHGEICHHLEPEYHADSISGQGRFCFQAFGWDRLDDARQAWFSYAATAQPWDISQGLIGGLWAVIARS